MGISSVIIVICFVLALFNHSRGVMAWGDFSNTAATHQPPSEEVQGQPPLTVSEELLLYLNRTLLVKHFISPDILIKTENYPDIFIINGIDKAELNELIEQPILSFNSSRIIESGWATPRTKIIILEEPNHYQAICKLVGSNHPVHLLKYDKNPNHRLRWIWSKGSPERLGRFIHARMPQPVELGGNELFEMVVKVHQEPTHPILIFGSSAVENSIFLSHVATKLCHVNPKRNIQLVSTFDEPLTLNPNSTELLVENLGNHAKKLTLNHNEFSQPWSKMDSSAITLVGNLDEMIEPARLWTTVLKLKPYSKADVRLNLDTYSFCCSLSEYHDSVINDKFNLLHYEVKPMSREDQVEFLGRFWSRGKEADLGKLEEFARHCLNALSLCMDRNRGDLVDPALQSLLLAEVYEEEAIEYAQIDESNDNLTRSPNITINSILEIYERLVANKIEKYEQSNDGNVSLDAKDVWDMHTRVALNILFPDKFDELKQSFGPIDMGELMKVGFLMEPIKSPRFIYPTLPEYFAVRGAMDRWRLELDYGGDDIKQFVFEGVLETRLGSWPNYNVSEFTQETMVHFLNELLPIPPTPSRDDSSLTFPSPEAMHNIAQACAVADAFQVLEYLYEMGGFDGNVKDIFNDKFVLLAIARSGVDLLKFAIDKLELYHEFDLKMKEKCRIAAHRGKLPILEFLLTEMGLLELVERMEGEDIKWLLHDCVKDSMYDQEHEIDERIQVARRLVGINPQLLEPKSGRSIIRPLFFSGVHPRLIIQLISLGANVLHQDKYSNNTILHLTLEGRHFTKEEYHSLVLTIPKDKLGQLINLKGSNGETALMKLVNCMDPIPETLELFREAGADYGGYQIPTLAVDGSRDLATLRKLIECGANFTWEGGWGDNTLLHMASAYGNLEAVKILVDEHGMGVNLENKYGITPLDQAIQSRLREGMRFETGVALLNRGGITGSIQFELESQSVLGDAASMNNLDSIRLLIHLGVDMNLEVNQQGDTALHRCLRFSYGRNDPIVVSLVKVLLEAGADLNIANDDGKTPLHLAFENGNLDMDIFQLLYSNANVSWTPNLASLTMITWIKLETGGGFMPIARELEARGALLNFTDLHGNTMLGVAARYGNERALQYLVDEKKLDVNQVSNLHDPKAPLHQAARLGNKNVSLRIVKYLVDHGANVYWRDWDGDTFLHCYIAEYGKPSASQFHSIVEYLIGKGHVDLFEMEGGHVGEYMTPYQLALRYMFPEVKTLELLRANGVGE